MNTPIPENTKAMFIDFFVGDSVKRVVRANGLVCKYTPKYAFDDTPFSFFEVVEVEKLNYKERFLAKSHYRRLLNKTQNITSALASLIRAVENLDEPISNKQLEKELELSKSLLSTMENYHTNN